MTQIREIGGWVFLVSGSFFAVYWLVTFSQGVTR